MTTDDVLTMAKEALEAHEAWEASIILDADWSRPTPLLTQAQCDALPVVQELRNKALAHLRSMIEVQR